MGPTASYFSCIIEQHINENGWTTHEKEEEEEEDGVAWVHHWFEGVQPNTAAWGGSRKENTIMVHGY